MQKRNCRFGTVRPILFSLSKEEHQSWDHLKVPFVFLICASDGQIFKCFSAKKGLVPQHSMSLLLLSITTRRGTGGCWTYLESQDGLGWKKHLEVIQSKTRPALMLDEVHQHVVQASSEYVQWQECHNITGQPLTAPNYFQCQNSFHYHSTEIYLSAICASSPFALHLWRTPGSIFLCWRHLWDLQLLTSPSFLISRPKQYIPSWISHC